MQKTIDPEVEKLRKMVDAMKGVLRAAGLSLDEFLHDQNTEPTVSHPVPDAGSGAHGMIVAGRGASQSVAGSGSQSVPTVASQSVSSSGSQSLPTVATRPVADEGINSQTLIKKKVHLMHYKNHDIAVVEGEVMSTNPDDSVHTVRLREGNCRVLVQKVIIPCVQLFRPTPEATLIDDALGSTVAWPIAAIRQRVLDCPQP